MNELSISRTKPPSSLASRTRRAIFAVLGGMLLLASGCSDGADTTTGRRILLGTTITAGAEATEPFTNSQGWTITLRTLLVSTGPLYYFDGAVIFSRHEPPRNRTYELLNEFLGIRSAHAHPGHYIPGDARGQLLNGTTVDLHAGPATLAMGEGVTGIVRSATFSYGATPQGPYAGVMGARVAIIEGTATQGDSTRVFRAEIDAADVLSTKSVAAIEGCPFEPTTMQTDGTVTIAVQLRYWFDQVEFDTVPESADGTPVLIPSTSIARNELVRGMKAGDAYVFSYSPKP